MANNGVSPSVEHALRERVKELTCLYEIAELSSRPGAARQEVLQGIVELLPRAWQYPEVCVAQIVLDGRTYRSPGFRDGVRRQGADIVLGGRRRGIVEVSYVEERPELDEGPFLREERELINAVAGQVALILARRKAEEDQARLQEQLRHADRLATIGVLAAGVAHELNEPLGGILGFAQLAKKCPGLPQQAKGDLERIEAASLHAREIIRKLMVFARQTPPRKALISLNQAVEDGLYFFAARCAKNGIELVRDLASGLPEIVADATQLNQVLANLIVNAIQAMPEGGTLTIQTAPHKRFVTVAVEDTGCGMSAEVLEKMFVPFFTTKGVGEGTGLGLSVVHGIVTAHGGRIRVKSKVGQGSRFEVQLPLPRRKAEKKGDSLRMKTEG